MYSVARLHTLGIKFIEQIKKWTREDKTWKPGNWKKLWK